MRGDYLMWKQIRANGDMAVRKGYLWLGTPETKTYNGSRDGRELEREELLPTLRRGGLPNFRPSSHTYLK